jgi:hypothetical protein
VVTRLPTLLLKCCTLDAFVVSMLIYKIERVVLALSHLNSLWGLEECKRAHIAPTTQTDIRPGTISSKDN